MIDCFWIRFEPDDNDTVMATCRALPEVTTFGVDQAQAADRALEAVAEAIAARMARWQDVPDGDEGEAGELPLYLPAAATLKLHVYGTVRGMGVSRAELQRRLGWGREQIDRLFRLDHASRVDQLEAALHVLGSRYRIGLEAIARSA